MNQTISTTGNAQDAESITENIMNWISVNDSLPINNTEDVLVTVDDHGIRYVIPDAMWEKGRWLKKTVDAHYEYGRNPWDEVFVDTEYEEIMQTVVAWQYQPDPYDG